MAVPVANALQESVKQVKLWCERMNTLWWIKGHGRSFKPFVANRVGEIQNMTSPEQWRYVPTRDNPADHLTKGMSASALACSEQWWKGPEFLKMVEEEWPDNRFEMSNDAVTEQKKSGYSKRKSVTENHEEKQSLFADAVRTKKYTTGEAVKNKLMKVDKENSVSNELNEREHIRLTYKNGLIIGYLNINSIRNIFLSLKTLI